MQSLAVNAREALTPHLSEMEYLSSLASPRLRRSKIVGMRKNMRYAGREVVRAHALGLEGFEDEDPSAYDFQDFDLSVREACFRFGRIGERSWEEAASALGILCISLSEPQADGKAFSSWASGDDVIPSREMPDCILMCARTGVSIKLEVKTRRILYRCEKARVDGVPMRAAQVNSFLRLAEEPGGIVKVAAFNLEHRSIGWQEIDSTLKPDRHHQISDPLIPLTRSIHRLSVVA